jgi:hypothetical protein
MTCIAAIADEGIVYMAGDRGMGDDSVILSTNTPKICIRGQYILGFAGSMGIGQLIKYVDLPDPGKNIDITLRLDLVKSLKDAIDAFGISVENNETDFLVGVQGRLFEINISDWQVAEYSLTAVGSGSPIALGSLHTSSTWKNPEKRLRSALNAAIDLSPGCVGPVDILSI